MSNWHAGDYSRLIKSLGLNDKQLKVLKTMMNDIYMDGWGDGVAHRSNLTPKEHSERLTSDIQQSWTQLIIDWIDE